MVDLQAGTAVTIVQQAKSLCQQQPDFLHKAINRTRLKKEYAENLKSPRLSWIIQCDSDDKTALTEG